LGSQKQEEADDEGTPPTKYTNAMVYFIVVGVRDGHRVDEIAVPSCSSRLKSKGSLVRFKVSRIEGMIFGPTSADPNSRQERDIRSDIARLAGWGQRPCQRGPDTIISDQKNMRWWRNQDATTLLALRL
jgi:hypothetical protein